MSEKMKIVIGYDGSEYADYILDEWLSFICAGDVDGCELPDYGHYFFGDYDSSTSSRDPGCSARHPLLTSTNPLAACLEYCDTRPSASGFEMIKRYASRLTCSFHVRSSFRFSQ